MSPTQVLHTAYLCIIAAILLLGGAAMLWWHHDAVLEGEAKCQKAQKAAIEKQRISDAEASQDVISGLTQDKILLQAQLDAKPPPVVRQCGRVYYVDRPLRPTPGTARAQPGEPAVPTVDSSVPVGGGAGDVGEGVRALAAAGEVLALYRERLYDYAVKTR